MATDRPGPGRLAAGLAVLTACAGPPFPARDACDVVLPVSVVVDDLELADALTFGEVAHEDAGGDRPTLLVPVTNGDLEVVTVRVDCVWFDAAGDAVGASPRQRLRLVPAARLDVRCVAPEHGAVRGVATFGWSR